MRKEQSMDLPFLSADLTFETSRAFRAPSKDSEEYRRLVELFTNRTEDTLIALDAEVMDRILGSNQGNNVWRLLRVKGDLSLILRLFRTYHPNWPETVTALRILASKQFDQEPFLALPVLISQLTSSPDSFLFQGYDFDGSFPDNQICMLILVGKEGEDDDDPVYGRVPPED